MKFLKYLNIFDNFPNYFSSKILKGLKNTSYLAFGNLASQIISFIGFIYIARLLGVNDLGIYTTVSVFVSTFDIFLFKGLKKTVLREGSKDVSSMHIYLDKTIGIRSVLIFCAIIVCIISSFFTNYDFQTKLFIIIFSSQLFFNGFDGFLSTIFQATEKMHFIAILSIINRVIFVTLAVVFLFFNYGLFSLFLISLLSHSITLIFRYYLSKKFVKFNIFSKIQIDKKILKSAFIFSLLLFVGFLTTKVDLLMISFLGTAENVGIYGVSYNIANQGEMLRNVTSIAFFPILVKQFHKSTIKGKLILKYSLFFLIGILFVSIIASFYVEEIVIFLFGKDYRYSGEILKILIFYLVAWWATMPLTTAAQATNNEKIVLLGRSFMAGLNIPLNIIFFIWYGLIGIAYSTLVIYSIGGFLLSIYSYTIMKKQGYLT
jgi:O-antigen/teichoic acid export membrane protein